MAIQTILLISTTWRVGGLSISLQKLFS
jgi:hypothetical protein